jgi:hypothetical protein
MNVVWGLLVVIVVATTAVLAMLKVRTRAPEGSYFADGDRASGVFGVLATGFSLLLGFLIFLTFTSYDEARSGAETEATLVLQQAETAQFMPGDTPQRLTGELVCYARTVVGPEWKAVDAHTLGDSVNPWGVAMFQTISSVDPRTYPQQSAYDRWMDQTGQREQARIDRLHGAEGIVPAPLWFALLLLCAVMFGFVLFFADPAEAAVTQGLLMGGVAVVITLLMLLLVFFDHPHGSGFGRLQPTAMERTLRLVDVELALADRHVTPPCDRHGARR